MDHETSHPVFEDSVQYMVHSNLDSCCLDSFCLLYGLHGPVRKG